MNKIRTREQLYDQISAQLAWRKKELANLSFLLQKHSLSASKKRVLIRCMITLLYAHWEGFIKNSSSAYVSYVSNKNLLNMELSENFLALSMSNLLMQAFQSKKVQDHIKVINFFQSEMETKSHIIYKNIISSDSNLSSKVLKEIVDRLGFDYSEYSTKEKLIDEKLLKFRNSVAHGEQIDYQITVDEVMALRKKIIDLMEFFTKQIDGAVTTKAYKA